MRVARDETAVLSLDDEERLVARAQAGEVEALRPLLTRFADPLYSAVILPRVGSAASAEDVLRDTLATAVEKIGSTARSDRSSRSPAIMRSRARRRPTPRSPRESTAVRSTASRTA